MRIKCKGGDQRDRDAEIEKETFRRQRHHQSLHVDCRSVHCSGLQNIHNYT